MKNFKNNSASAISTLSQKFAQIKLTKKSQQQVKGGDDIIIEDTIDF